MDKTSTLLVLALCIGSQTHAFTDDCSTPDDEGQETTTQQYIETTPTDTSSQVCPIAGGCTTPPAIPGGSSCQLESNNGRTYAQYTASERLDVPTFDHCPVSVCTGNNRWSVFNVSMSSKECYTNRYYSGAAIYSGKNTCTVSGRTCQRWNTDYPHERNPKHIPKDYTDRQTNYCMDPGPPYDKKPWCYTTDPKVRWEFCYVPKC